MNDVTLTKQERTAFADLISQGPWQAERGRIPSRDAWHSALIRQDAADLEHLLSVAAQVVTLKRETLDGLFKSCFHRLDGFNGVHSCQHRWSDVIVVVSTLLNVLRTEGLR